MKVLLVGTGGVGEAMAVIINRYDPGRKWLEKMVLADCDVERSRKVSERIGDEQRFPAEQLNARNPAEISWLVKKYDVDLLVNACDPSFNEVLFDTAYECGINYIDMAMSLSRRHPQDPFHKCHVKLGDYQFSKEKLWAEKGLLALVGSGVEPGMSDVFARYGEKHLFDEIEEIGIRDGANLRVEGHDIVFGFSIWTTIEECLNPPVIWERDRGWYTTEPFSGKETFVLPEGIGPVEMVNVEHEEVLLIPRYVDKGLKRVTFKYGLGDDFIQALKYLQAVNMDRTDMKIPVGNSEITPRDFLVKLAPDPARIGDRMTGKTCAGTWIKGKKDGLEREVYLYQVADNETCMKELGCQAVVAQTAFNPVIMMELIAKRIWTGAGVHGPEAFDPDPFVARMEACGFPGGHMEMESEYLRNIQRGGFTRPIATQKRAFIRKPRREAQLAPCA